MELTWPFALGRAPFITVGELGANLAYLWESEVRGSYNQHLLEGVEVSEGVSDGVSEYEDMEVGHKLLFSLEHLWETK